MDNAIWATWYDLSDADETEFLIWLHDEHLPKLRARSGVSWVAHYQAGGAEGPKMQAVRDTLGRPEDPSIGTGTQYLLLVGAPEPLTLLSPSVLADEKAETGRIREMLDRRIGVRSCFFNVFARVTGPEIGLRTPGTTPGPVIQMGAFRTRTVEDEYDVAAWYAQHRLPAMARMPGCIAARTMLCAGGWPKFSVLYEFTSLEARREHFEEQHEALGLEEAEWTHRVHHYTVHAPGSPSVGTRLWPPV